MPTILRSPAPDIAIPDVSLTAFVFERAHAWPDRVALTCGVSGQQYTFAALEATIRGAAAGLWAEGIRPGDVVGLVSANVPDFVVLLHAVASLGAATTTVNPLATPEELVAQFRDSGARRLVTIPALVEKVQGVASELGLPPVITFGETAGAIPFASLVRHDLPVPAVSFDPARTLAVLPYSSGTSGLPKGVMLTHRNLIANLLQVEAADRILEPTDRLLAVLPFFHIYGMVPVMNGALRQGCPLVTLPRFDLELFLRTIETHALTFAHIVPPILVGLAKHPMVDQFRLSSLRALFSGAAPLGEELARAVEARLGCVVRQGYGLTETSPVTHFHPLSGDRVRHGSVGPLVPNTEARLVDDEGHDVAVGERGELWMRGPQVMVGYLNKPEATAACLDAEGWFHSGDVAVVDDAGWFTIVDRVKELIKYKGMQVAPAELEAVLLAHPGVADAAVIPVPDAEAGELPKAFVVARGALTAEEVMAHVAEHVSPYKRVRLVEFVEAIPKSPSGKILRRLLVDRERAARAGA
jgi:acyl-CoA synthetase (AMP-forming)/AMP-acid ligase II